MYLHHRTQRTLRVGHFPLLLFLVLIANKSIATEARIHDTDDDTGSTADEVITPKVQWAQDEKDLIVTVLVPDIEEHEVDLTDTGFVLEAEDGDGHKYRLEMELREFVDPRASTWKQTPSSLMLTLKKVHPHFWDRLLEDTSKTHQRHGGLKIDLTRWKDIPEALDNCQPKF